MPYMCKLTHSEGVCYTHIRQQMKGFGGKNEQIQVGSVSIVCELHHCLQNKLTYRDTCTCPVCHPVGSLLLGIIFV